MLNRNANYRSKENHKKKRKRKKKFQCVKYVIKRVKINVSRSADRTELSRTESMDARLFLVC